MTEWTVRSSVLHASLWNTMTTLVRGRLSGYSLFLHLQRGTRGEKGTFLVSQLACDPPQTRAKRQRKTRGGGDKDLVTTWETEGTMSPAAAALSHHLWGI